MARREQRSIISNGVNDISSVWVVMSLVLIFLEIKKI